MVSYGPVEETYTAENLSETYGGPVIMLGRVDERRAGAHAPPRATTRTTSTSTRTWARSTTDGLSEYFTDPLQYEFMRRALIEVIIMGAVTGAIGTYIVLRGLSFIGDALSHAIFPGIVIAFLLGRSIFLGALLFGVLTSARSPSWRRTGA